MRAGRVGGARERHRLREHGCDHQLGPWESVPGDAELEVAIDPPAGPRAVVSMVVKEFAHFHGRLGVVRQVCLEHREEEIVARDRTLPGPVRIRHWTISVDVRVVEERRVSSELRQFGVQRADAGVLRVRGLGVIPRSKGTREAELTVFDIRLDVQVVGADDEGHAGHDPAQHEKECAGERIFRGRIAGSARILVSRRPMDDGAG